MSSLRPDPDAVPRSRSEDPSASHDAEARMRQSGRMESDRDELVRMVAWFPGRSIPGLAMLANQEEPTGESQEERRQRYGRRAVEAERMGLIHPSGERNGSRLWWPGPPLPPEELPVKEEPKPGQQSLFDGPTKTTWD